MQCGVTPAGRYSARARLPVYKSVLAVLPDADAWGDDNEEMYYPVGFQVTEDNGYVAPWTSWEDSPVVTFHL